MHQFTTTGDTNRHYGRYTHIPDSLIRRSSISIELAATMFLQRRSERRRYREMILGRAKNNDSKGCSEDKKPKDIIDNNKLKNKELRTIKEKEREQPKSSATRERT